MTPRERVLARRHLATVEEMRDATWPRVHGGNVSRILGQYEALRYAVEAIRRDLDADSITKGKSAAA